MKSDVDFTKGFEFNDGVDSESYEMLQTYTKNPPECCHCCYFMVKPKSLMFNDVYPGWCSLDTKFDLNINWRYIVSDENNCTNITFLKKLIEVI